MSAAIEFDLDETPVCERCEKPVSDVDAECVCSECRNREMTEGDGVLPEDAGSDETDAAMEEIARDSRAVIALENLRCAYNGISTDYYESAYLYLGTLGREMRANVERVAAARGWL
jgi:hypothetical protein